MTQTHWLSSETDLFLITRDGPQHLPVIGIDSIRWSADKGTWMCASCGFVHPVTRSHCWDGVNGCGAARSIHALGHAIVSFTGPMPSAKSIFFLPEGALVEMTWACSGPRADHRPEIVMMRFVDCHTVGREMLDVCANNPDSASWIALRVDVECEVELWPDGMEAR